MKTNRNYLWTYAVTLVIGVLLLVFTGRTNLFEIIVIIIGALFILPSLVLLFVGLQGRKDAEGRRQSLPWYMGVTAVGGLIFGILLVCMPGFFASYLIYTMSILLILVGVGQIVNLSAESNDVGGMSGVWYIMPWLTIAGGVAMIIIGPERIADAVTIITGVLMVLYSLNGFLGAGAHHSAKKRIARQQAGAEEAPAEATSTAEETPAAESTADEARDTAQ